MWWRHVSAFSFAFIFDIFCCCCCYLSIYMTCEISPIKFKPILCVSLSNYTKTDLSMAIDINNMTIVLLFFIFALVETENLKNLA